MASQPVGQDVNAGSHLSGRSTGVIMASTLSSGARLQLHLWGMAWRRVPQEARRRMLNASGFSPISNTAFSTLPRVRCATISRGGLRRQEVAPPTMYGLAKGLTEQRRSFLFRFVEHQKLKGLEMEAKAAPHDPVKQYRFLSELNRLYPESVIQYYETAQCARDEAVTKEYIKALSKVGKLDRVPLEAMIPQMAHQGEAAGAAAAGGNAAPAASAAAAGAMGGAGAGRPAFYGGTDATNPLHVTMVEPGFKQQLWKTARFVLGMFLVISALSAMVDDRGISSRLMMNTNLHMAESSDKRFADVMGVDEAKTELEEIVMYLKDPTKFTRLGGKLPKGLLLMGPPGTGKTLLARAIAGEAGVPFFYSSGSEFEEMYVGVGARRVRDLFEAAKKRAPCIIFIDEIDAIGGARHLKDQQAMKMTLNQLLVELDGFEQNKGVIIIGATNYPQSLDQALLRPGRFDKHVIVPLPDVRGRKQILDMYTKKVPCDTDVDLDTLARATPGMSGADLSNVVNQAALKAAIDGLKAIDMHSFEWAKDKILMGAERKSMLITKETATITAYHEGGHALVAMYTSGADEVYKATIMPRGQALGMVTQLPDGDRHNYTKKQALARMDVCMGGRVAEELIFGEVNVTSGASSDFEQAYNLARSMVTKWGMSEVVGPVAHKEKEMSPETRALIDREVKSILEQSYQRAKNILHQHRADLDVLAKALLEHETLTGKEIKDLLAGKRLKKPKIAAAPQSTPPPAAADNKSAGGKTTTPGLLRDG